MRLEHNILIKGIYRAGDFLIMEHLQVAGVQSGGISWNNARCATAEVTAEMLG